MTVSKLRVQKLLSRWLSLILVGLLVLGLLGGYVTYHTHVAPGTEIEEVEQSSWSTAGAYEHHATVQRDVAPFEAGSVLENRPQYLTAVSPVLNGTYHFEYRASDGCDLTITVEQTRILQSVGEDGESVFWRTETVQSEETVEAVESGDSVTVPFSINVTAARHQIEEIETQLDQTPGETGIRLESRVHVTGERNGESVDETVTHGFDVDDQGSVYSVQPDEGMTDSGQSVEETVVTASYGPVRSIGAPLLLVLSLLGTIGLLVGHVRNAFQLSNREQEWLDYEQTRAEYNSWISEGRLPDDALSRPRVAVDTLEGLVDVAIDSDRRVIRDSSRGICAVLLPESVYTFDIPPSPGDGPEPLDSSGETDPRESDAVSNDADTEEASTADSSGPEETAKNEADLEGPVPSDNQ